MMTKEEYLARAAAQDDWSPGWEAIDEAFAALYPGVEPAHLATALPARAMFGGPEHLDGISFFPSPGGYQHLLTYGLSNLYVAGASVFSTAGSVNPTLTLVALTLRLADHLKG